MSLDWGKIQFECTPDEMNALENFDKHSIEDIKKAREALRFLDRVRSARRESFVQRDTLKPLGSTDLETPGNDSDIPFPTSHDHHGASGVNLRKFGRFEILKSIGSGGFAEVWLARDPRLDRLVAIKVPSFRAMASRDSRARFTREAEAAAMLSHPAIVPVYETGNIGPLSFIAYQYCAGDSLAAWFETQNRSVQPEIAAELIHRIAQAVQHAHHRGVIHRDLKPQNVLIAEDTNDLDIAHQLRITDFGLARYVIQTDQSLTMEGSVLGTPAYMSPEQARGAQEVSAATDIYSIGVMLYELLTGRLPHNKESHLATIRAIETEEPPPPRRLRPMVPRDLEAICLKCLNKSPARRYTTANDLADDLQAWLTGKTVSARHAGKLEKLARWAQRNKTLSATLSFAIVCLVTGLGLALWQWNKSEANLLSSNLQRDRAQKNFNMLETTVDRVLDRFVEELEENPKLSEFQTGVLNELLTVHRSLVDDEAEQLQEKLASIKAYLRIANIYRNSFQTDEAINVCKQALALADNSKPGEADHVAIQKDRIYTLTMLGILQLQREPFIQSQKVLETARRDLQTIRNLYSPGELLSNEFHIVRHLQICYRSQRNREKSEQANRDLQKIALAMIREIESYPNKSLDNHDTIMYAIHDLARIEKVAGNREAYFQRLQQALDYANNLNGVEHFDRPKLAYTHAQLADYYMRTGDYENAANHNDLTIEIREAQIKKNPEDSDAIRGLLFATMLRIRILIAQDQLEKADETFRNAIDSAREAGDRQFKFDTMTMLYTRYADFFCTNLDDPTAATENYQLALEIGKDFGSQPDSSVGVRDHLRDAAFGMAKLLEDDQPETANELMQYAVETSNKILKMAPGMRTHQDRAVEITRTIADSRVESQKYGDVCLLWDQLIVVEPDSPHLRYQAAQYLAETLTHARESGVVDSGAAVLKEIRKATLKHLEAAVDVGFKNIKLFQRPMWRVFSDNQLQPFIDSVESANPDQ